MPKAGHRFQNVTPVRHLQGAGANTRRRGLHHEPTRRAPSHRAAPAFGCAAWASRMAEAAALVWGPQTDEEGIAISRPAAGLRSRSEKSLTTGLGWRCAKQGKHWSAKGTLAPVVPGSGPSMEDAKPPVLQRLLLLVLGWQTAHMQRSCACCFQAPSGCPTALTAAALALAAHGSAPSAAGSSSPVLLSILAAYPAERPATGLGRR